MKKIDSIIKNPSKKYYTFSEKIFIQKNGNFYDLVLVSLDNKRIVSVLGGRTNSLKGIKDIEKMLRNAGKEVFSIDPNMK